MLLGVVALYLVFRRLVGALVGVLWSAFVVGSGSVLRLCDDLCVLAIWINVLDTSCGRSLVSALESEEICSWILVSSSV